MAKKLVINADDFGLAEGVNSGVMECYRRGGITYTSMLACGDSFEHAADLARKNNIKKLGCHLALTGSFKPVSESKDIKTLVKTDGRFPEGYAGFLYKFLIGNINKGEIYKEFKGQIARIKKQGFTVTHLDSHHHIHAVPGILKIALGLMKEEGIEYVRFPLERLKISAKFSDLGGFMRNILLSSMCGLSKGILSASGVKHNDYFIGHARALKLCKADLMSYIPGLKDGLTELAVHPGRFTELVEEKYPYYKNCEEELKALCDSEIFDEIKKRSVELVAY